MKYTILIFLILFSAPSWAQSNTQNTDRFLDIQELKTPSGIPVWLVEDHSVPVISLQFAFKGAGSLLERPQQQGLTQLLSNMMDEGAGPLDSQAFQQALSDHSISLSFSGGRDQFGGSLKALTIHKNKAFELLELALTQPRFDAEPLERMKQANMSRIKNSMTDPNWIAARLMNDRAFAGHPYAQNSGGTLSTLPTITGDDLRKFVKNEFSRERLMIAVSGDITAKEALTKIDTIFSSFPHVKREMDLVPTPLKNKNTIILFEQDIPQTIIKIIFPGIRQGEQDYYAAKIMNHIFGAGGFGSRLMEEIREKEGLTYGIYSHLSQMEWAETLSISTSTQNENVKKLLSLIKAEANKIKETPITENELQNAKDYILGSMPLALTSTNALSSIMLSLQIDNLPATYLDTLDTHINAVTLEEIQAVAQRLLDMDNALIILVGQPQNIDNTSIVTTLPNVE